MRREEVADGYIQNRVVSLRQPNLTLFSVKQLELVDAVIEAVWGTTANDVSEWSHGNAWKIAENGERIPYQAVFISDAPVDEFDRKRATELAHAYAWQ